MPSPAKHVPRPTVVGLLVSCFALLSLLGAASAFAQTERAADQESPAAPSESEPADPKVPDASAPSAPSADDVPGPDVAEEAPPAAVEPEPQATSEVEPAAPSNAPDRLEEPVAAPIGASSGPVQPSAAPEARRTKNLLITVGVSPTKLDIGSEADLLGVSSPEDLSERLDKWSYTLKGYLRAPMRFSIGPRNDYQSGSELHSPPRIVGLSSGKWDYVALAQNPALSMYVNFGNPLVSANVIFGASTFTEASWPDLDRVGGIRQAYLTLKKPDLFGKRGGMALMAGGFSNRYGSAGRYQASSGYYGTYLFGRTHTAGYNLAANLDLTDDLQIVVEQGFGAKISPIPFVTTTVHDYFQGVGPQPQGSNLVNHMHVGLIYRNWLRVMGHHVSSWTPDDHNINTARGRMDVYGGEIHVDGDAIGNGYLGYARLEGRNLLSLADGVQVIHGSNGRGIKENYFGNSEPVGPDGRALSRPTNETGTVDTVLFQYLVRLAPYVPQMPLGMRDASLAVYGMFNHARSQARPNSFDIDIRENKLKFGAEMQVELFKYMSLGARYDYVHRDLADSETRYQAISPRLFFRSTWKTKEVVIVNYTHYFLGERTTPGSPYTNLSRSDPDMFMVAVLMSF